MKPPAPVNRRLRERRSRSTVRVSRADGPPKASRRLARPPPEASAGLTLRCAMGGGRSPGLLCATPRPAVRARRYTFSVVGVRALSACGGDPLRGLFFVRARSLVFSLCRRCCPPPVRLRCHRSACGAPCSCRPQKTGGPPSLEVSQGRGSRRLAKVWPLASADGPPHSFGVVRILPSSFFQRSPVRLSFNRILAPPTPSSLPRFSASPARP